MENLTQHFDSRLDVDELVEYSLPLFHSCDGFTFRKILESKKLLPSKCVVFKNEKLLYLFYGRPAYKNSDPLSHKLGHLLPTAFILKNSIGIGGKRIAPFDTGAFKRGLFEKYMHPKMQIEDFLLSPGVDGIRKTISYFFGSNEKYYIGEPKSELNCDSMDFEIRAYHSLINGVVPEEADDRKASIEIQLDHEICLSKDTVQAVICPKEFERSNIFKRVVKDELNAEVITYLSYSLPSNSYHALVLNLVQEYLKSSLK